MTFPEPPDQVASGRNAQPLLAVKNLKTYFELGDGLAKAVDSVSFSVERGKTLGIVGESGCGKSGPGRSVMRLGSPPGRIVDGEILFDGRDLLRLPEPEMRRLRGREISMVFQEPMTSLNPVFTVGAQIIETILLHEQVSRRDARDRAIDMLRKVKIPAAESRIDDYPHQMSGGMRQRVMVAMALACSPRLLIADEPTTALDVTIQAQILDLLRELQAENDMAVLLITHDLGVVAEVADHVLVMYASRVAESAAVESIFTRPLHPYTRGLFASRPRLGMRADEPLNVIPGNVPNPLSFPSGCRFHPRCSMAVAACTASEPALRELAAGHLVGCDLATGESDG